MIKSGTILIQKDALRPQCFQVEDGSYPDAWMPVTHHLTPRELETELSSEGWTFFYMASSIRRTAFGFNQARMIHAALERVIAGVKQRKCNCLEIDGVVMHSFLGIPYVTVSAHPRHIQKGILFVGQTDREAAKVAPPNHLDEMAHKTWADAEAAEATRHS
jgi:hypothetical protein